MCGYPDLACRDDVDFHAAVFGITPIAGLVWFNGAELTHAHNGKPRFGEPFLGEDFFHGDSTMCGKMPIGGVFYPGIGF